MSFRPLLLKTTLFLAPLFCSYLFTQFLYTTSHGDLIRIGYIAKDSEYHNQVHEQPKPPLKYIELDNYDLTSQTDKTRVLIIGDSFSDKHQIAYNNYLAQNDSLEIIRFNSLANPISLLYGIINGDILDSIHFDYIILQSVERYFTLRGQTANENTQLLIKDLSINNKVATECDEKQSYNFTIPIEVVKFPIYNLFYLFNDHALFSDTYRIKLKQSYFSGRRNNELLCFMDDIKNTPLNNNVEAVNELNNKLNRLSNSLFQKNISLIVLPAPDKYDIYYNIIEHQERYAQPMFFDHFNSLDKNYIYINSKELLTNQLHQRKDIYYYDDSHWSARTAQFIGQKLDSIISKN